MDDDDKFQMKHILKAWFEGWKHPLKEKFCLAPNSAGADGIAVGGYMVAFCVDGDKLELLYSDPEHFKHINVSDKDFFDKLADHLPKVYETLKKKGWT